MRDLLIYNPGKFYSIDIALSNSIGFRFSENLGHIYENIVFLELKRKNKELYYWKSKTGKEVDFVLYGNGYYWQSYEISCYYQKEWGLVDWLA